MQQSPAFAGEANLPHSQLMRYFGTRIGMKPVPRMFCLGLLLLWTWNLVGCTVPNRKRDIPQVKLTIQNTLPIKRESVPIVLALDELKQIASDFSFDAYLVGQPPREIHSQADDTNYDGQRDELVFLVDLEPQETKEVSIRYSSSNQMPITLGFPKRTRVGIFPELGGFAAFESELIAYLFYPSGSIRPYAKKTKGLFIDRLVREVAAPSNSSEEAMTPLTATNDLIGAGGYALWDTANQKLIALPDSAQDYVRVLADGPVRSVVQRIIPSLQLSNSILHLTSTLSIYAGNRWGEHRIKVQGWSDQYRIAIGVPNRGIAMKKSEKKGWLWTWDEQETTSPSTQVGFGLIYPVAQFETFQDAINLGSQRVYTVLLTPDENGEVVYRFSSIWEEGEAGIQTKEEFDLHVEVTATEIQTPPVIRLLPQTPEA